MRTARIFPKTGRLRNAVAALLSVVAFSAPGNPGEAAPITGSYELEYNQDVTTKDVEREDIRKFTQRVDLKYAGFLSPVVAHDARFSIDVEQEFKSSAADTTRLLPTLDLGFRGSYWDVKAGVKRTHENSDEPGKNPKTTDNWFVEFLYSAPSRVPDLKAKYTLDTDFEEGTTDTQDDEIAISSVYHPNDWLEMKGEYTRNTTDDRLNPDSDTEEEKSTGTVGIRRLISTKVKAEAEYSIELIRGATLLDAGGTTSDKDEQTHKVRTKLSYLPFRDTSLDGSYDYQLKQDMVLGEHTLTTDIKGTVSQRIGKPFEIKGEFVRNITESRHTVDDNTETEDTWTVDFKARFSKQLDFTVRHKDEHTVEDHVDVAKNRTKSTLTDSATWTGELAPFWNAGVSFEETDTFEWNPIELREERTTTDKKYSLKCTFDFKAINLTLDPTYDITRKDNHGPVEPKSTETRDFKFKLAYRVLLTRAIETKIDHTYGRKVDTAAGNIERTDTTNGNMTWTDPLPGWIVAIDLTRSATDKSEDDLPAEINSTFGFKVDYKYEWLTMNLSYKYDKKLPKELDDGETFDAKAGWTAPRWELSLAYNFSKVFSSELDEKYSLTLSFKYNL